MAGLLWLAVPLFLFFCNTATRPCCTGAGGEGGRLEAGGGADMRRSAAESRDRETVTGEEKFPAKLSVVGPQTSQFWE